MKRQNSAFAECGFYFEMWSPRRNAIAARNSRKNSLTLYYNLPSLITNPTKRPDRQGKEQMTRMHMIAKAFFSKTKREKTIHELSSMVLNSLEMVTLTTKTKVWRWPSDIAKKNKTLWYRNLPTIYTLTRALDEILIVSNTCWHKNWILCASK